jgi:hypothetical protein
MHRAAQVLPLVYVGAECLGKKISAVTTSPYVCVCVGGGGGLHSDAAGCDPWIYLGTTCAQLDGSQS